MPLRVKTLVEPVTERSRSIKPILAESDEYYRLYRDLQRYTTDEISGRSYLIAGHRGSGKTILVHSAIEELWRNSQGLVKRPLLIRLYGPDLLPKRKKASPDIVDQGKTVTNQIAISVSGDSPASVSTSQPNAPRQESESDFENVLIQLTKGLVRDVTNEFRRCFRETIVNTPGLRRKRDDLLELAAQLELEVSESTNPARLRSFWQRIGKLRDGVLFLPPQKDSPGYMTPQRTDAGLQEILVLAFVSQAYQVVSGKIEEKQKQTDLAKQQQSSAVSTAYALKDAFAPIIGLISGGSVGVALGINGNSALTSVALGLLAGGVVSFGFSFSSARTRSKETTLESTFIRDRSVTTLSSAIPLLIRRLKAIGLAPIFVVDEMDKVEGIQERMPNLIHHFKYLLTENSFFCFLADRRFLTYHVQQSNKSAYAPEYTYFSHTLLVLYKPSDLRAFVKDALESIAPIQQVQTVDPELMAAKDREDILKIAYVLLHRARLHPMELRREIDRLAHKDSFSIADFRDGYAIEIFIQLAIESLVESAEVQHHIDAHPHNRQLVYDALYYVSRLWECTSDASSAIPGFQEFEVDKKPGFILDEIKFTAYMQSRYAEERDKKEPSQSEGAVDLGTKEPENAPDFRFLFALVKELLNRLSSPKEFRQNLFARQSENKIPPYVLNVIPNTPPFEHDGDSYRWLYDVSGRSFATGEIKTLLSDVVSHIANIEAAEKNIRLLGVEEGLQILSDATIVPRTPEWKVVRRSLERIKPLIAKPPRRMPPNLMQDRERLLQFASILRDFLPNVKGALIVASLFAHGVETPHVEGEQAVPSPEEFVGTLKKVSRLMGLSASRLADSEKINSVLSSAPQPIALDLEEDDWTSILNVIRDQLKGSKPAATPEFIDAMWGVYRERFIEGFRDGTWQFAPMFGDILTSSQASDPGRSLSPNLMALTAGDWATLLLRTVLDEDSNKLPDWMRVAAAVRLGLVELAEKFAKRISTGDSVPLQWVRQTRDQITAHGAIRHGALVLAAAGDADAGDEAKSLKKSLTSEWKPSARHGALVCTFDDFTRLMDALTKDQITNPADFPIDSLYVELAGLPPGLAEVAVTERPLSAILKMKGNLAYSNTLEVFLNKLETCYFVSQPINVSSTSQRVIVDPKGLDDLIERSSGAPIRSAQ